MSKALFRWLRGELNGFYLTNIYYSWNTYTEYVKNFFHEMKSKQFELNKISDSDLRGIGKFAGVFLPRLAKEESYSSIRLTESTEETLGEEISESGLFKPDVESFDFSKRGVSSDINDNATSNLRSSLVGNEDAIGYISSSEEDILDSEGKVRSDKILTSPPEDSAYADFYGNQFLFLSEAKTVYENLEKSLYIELYKAMQWVRYNGVSLESLRKIISICCPSKLVTIDSVSSIEKIILVHYTYHDEVEITLKAQRLYLLNYIVGIKFPQVIMIES